MENRSALSEALKEYKSDPRKDWFGFLCDVPQDGRKENYLKLLLSDTLEAAHDGEIIAQDLDSVLLSAPTSLEELERVGKALEIIIDNPFFHSSLLSFPPLIALLERWESMRKKQDERKEEFLLFSLPIGRASSLFPLILFPQS